jgi:hypothetical protein
MNDFKWVADARIIKDTGEACVLVYYISIMGDDIPLYGLKVEKRSETGQLLETETTPALTASHEEAVRLARFFAKGSVPPCTLLEMTDEVFAS